MIVRLVILIEGQGIQFTEDQDYVGPVRDKLVAPLLGLLMGRMRCDRPVCPGQRRRSVDSGSGLGDQRSDTDSVGLRHVGCEVLGNRLLNHCLPRGQGPFLGPARPLGIAAAIV
jgi:hypothetical protein